MVRYSSTPPTRCQRAFHTDARSVPLVAELVQSLVAENPAVQHPQSKELELALKRHRKQAFLGRSKAI